MRGKKKGKSHSHKHASKAVKVMSPGVTGYIARSQVTKKLQLNIHQFRQLCILKGIHPVEPGLKRVRKNIAKTWFYLKDINYMRRDEIVKWFADVKIYQNKKKALKASRRYLELSSLKERKPKLNMDHFVRERYPTLQDAVNDLDDGLSLIFLFVEMQYGQISKIMSKKLFQECIRLKSEWQAYVTETHALRKMFVSIKGIYYQAEVLGSPVTWLVPHPQRIKVPMNTDILTMSFFVQFYTTALSFVFYRLFTDQGYVYPPALDKVLLAENQSARAAKMQKVEALIPTLKNETPAVPSSTIVPLTDAEKARIAIVNKSLAHIISVDEQETKEEEKREGAGAGEVEVKIEPSEEDQGEVIPKEFQEVDEKEGENKEQYVRKERLFSGFKFFINREIPSSEIRFVIRAFGGEDFTEYDCEDSDTKITHQIVDRDCSHMKLQLNREYVQPQWLFDSVNAGILLPYHEYAHNATLPPHISPFINDKLKGYVPEQREHLDELIAQSKNGESIPMGKSEKDEEEGEQKYIGQDDEEDPESIEAQYARELAAEQGGKSYAGYVEDEMGETKMYDDDDDEELEEALKKKPLTKQEKVAQAQKKDEEERERMSIDLLNRRTRNKVLSIKRRLIRAKENNETLMEKRKEAKKKKVPTPSEQKKMAKKEKRKERKREENQGKRKEVGETEETPAKKVKK